MLHQQAKGCRCLSPENQRRQHLSPPLPTVSMEATSHNLVFAPVDRPPECHKAGNEMMVCVEACPTGVCCVPPWASGTFNMSSSLPAVFNASSVALAAFRSRVLLEKDELHRVVVLVRVLMFVPVFYLLLVSLSISLFVPLSSFFLPVHKDLYLCFFLYLYQRTIFII